MSCSPRRPFAVPHRLFSSARLPVLQLAFAGLLSAMCTTVPARAAGKDIDATPEALAQLEQQASHANPREQCFLYTEVVHAMTQKAGKEIADGNSEQATSTLKQINHYIGLIRRNLVHNAKRLKDAQELMHNTTYRLAQVLHLVSGEDKDTVQATLQQLDQVNDELLTQVFTQ